MSCHFLTISLWFQILWLFPIKLEMLLQKTIYLTFSLSHDSHDIFQESAALGHELHASFWPLVHVPLIFPFTFLCFFNRDFDQMTSKMQFTRTSIAISKILRMQFCFCSRIEQKIDDLWTMNRKCFSFEPIGNTSTVSYPWFETPQAKRNMKMTGTVTWLIRWVHKLNRKSMIYEQ